MKPERRSRSDLGELRNRAEKALAEKEGRVDGMPFSDIKQLIHELGVYQVELEMQNEELRRAQEVIEDSRRKYVDLYDFAPVGYLTLDSSARLIEMNLTASNMLGVERERLKGIFFLKNFVYSEDVEKLRAHTALVKKSQKTEVMELRMVRPDGTHFQAELRSRLVGTEGGEIIHTAVTDVHELREAEAARKTSEKAEKAAQKEVENLKMQRLENLRVLAGGIAHDLNNLMVAVQANAELALLELPEGKAREYVEGIEAAVSRVSSLAHQILSYTGQGQAVREPVDLNHCLKETSKLLIASLPKHASLEYDLSDGLPPVVADHQGIQQIMINLVINAADALEGKRGRISLATGSVHADKEYLDRIKTTISLPEGRYVFFEVADTGRGMSAETLEQVFEPFYTTKVKGRGLGLSVVAGIARSHGGGIEVESKRGAGTRFRVLLPWPEKTVVVKAEPSVEMKDVWKGKGTILVVDDEKDVLDMTRTVLDMAGYEVLTASSGEEALLVFSANRDKISAAVLDLIMPEMRGDELYRELCVLKQGLKAMFLSGYHELDVESLDTKRCPVSVLQKPYKINDMLKKMHEFLKE